MSRVAATTPRALTVFLLGLVLTACGGDGMSDLRDWVTKTKAKPGGRVEPLPEIKPFETFAYDESNRRSPFALGTGGPTRVQGGRGVTGGVQPDVNRRKEALESYPLDSLHMVGTLDRGGQKWALVSAPDKMVYRVLQGNHLGQNFGRIKRITENKLELIEVVPDGVGGWIERDAALTLTE